VHNPRPQNAVDAGEIFTVKKKGVDQCSRRISVSRVNNHTRRLVNHDEGWVLMENVERKRLGLE
jgi:transcriptional accessory protein Tex/SPT6